MEDALQRLAQFARPGARMARLARFLPAELRGAAVGRSALASTFAASFELARDGRVELRQDRAFGPIYLRSPPERAHGSAAGERRSAQQLRLLEALLFAAAEPLTRTSGAAARRRADLAALLRELAEHYAGRGVNLVRLAGGWTFRTAPDLAPRAAHRADGRRANCRAPRSRPWRSSPITSR